MSKVVNSAIECGNVNGRVKETKSSVSVSEVTIRLDSETAWALCNILSKDNINDCYTLEEDQREMLLSLGKAIALPLDHPSNNLRKINNE